MPTQQRPPALTLAIGTVIALAVILFITDGTGGVFVLAVAGLLAAGHLAHRYVTTHLGWHYPRNGDRMD